MHTEGVKTMIDNNKNELNKRELNMDELEMVTGGVEDEGTSIEVHNFFNDNSNNGEEAPVDIPFVSRIKI